MNTSNHSDNQWWKITIETTHPEDLGAELIDKGAAGVEIASEKQLAAFYLASLKQIERTKRDLEALGSVRVVSIEAIPDTNWSQQCEELLAPTRLGRFSVLPVTGPEQSIQQSDDSIVICPGTGFGTGHHETTKLCWELVEKHRAITDAATVLDIGTGSGILSIAAARMGAKWVVALDPDLLAIENTKVNLALNSPYSERISLFAGAVPAIGAGTFDLVVANLYAALHASLIPQYARLASPKTVLVISGMRHWEGEEISTQLMANGWRKNGSLESGGWVAYAWQR